MTEALLLIICEAGWLEFEALARSGSCNRSLYAIWEKLLRPKVANKRFRLFLKIRTATVSLAKRTELRHHQKLRLWWRYRHARWRLGHWEMKLLRLGCSFIDYQIWESALQRDRWVKVLRHNTESGIREKHKYSPETIRSWRYLSEALQRERRDLTRPCCYG